MSRVCLVLATLVLQLVVGEDVYWTRNSNWNNADNWRFGRPPCGGEVASFAEAQTNSLVYVSTNITVKSIVLPTSGKLVLKPGLTIRFSNESSCTVPGDSKPMVAEVNEFTGARVWSWECPHNWANEDDSPVARPPCGEDTAVFREGSSYSFIKSNQSITVRSLRVRGDDILSTNDLQSSEFQLSLTVNSACGSDSTLCPCPSLTGCPDIDECQLGMANCHNNATCINTLGSYECQCIKGYRGNGISCTDIDECAEGTAVCPSNAVCVNTKGGYQCRCRKGFIGNGISCSDVDECTRNMHTCHSDADCINTNGSYVCQCRPGFTGDGEADCQDLNECTLGIDNCAPMAATCSNLPGSFVCRCLGGYSGDGVICKDEDECELKSDKCDDNADCVNTEGSYDCVCKPGFENDGCTAVAKPNEGEGSNMVGVIAGVVVAVLVVTVVVVIAVILGIVIYRRRTRTISYIKDDFLEPGGDVFQETVKPADKESENDSVTFSNPIYSSHTHAPTDDSIGLIGAEIVAEDQPDDLKQEYEKVDLSAALNEYESL